jgi:MFS family permease
LLSLDKFGINVYFDQILVGLVEIFGALFGVYIVPRVARKRFVTIALIIIAVICAGMGIESLTYHHEDDELNFHTIIEMVLIAILRFVISSLWGLLFVYVSELYPNEVSSLSYGWISVAGTVGASISPYIRLATANLTMFIMAILSVAMAFFTQSLNETKGKAIRTRILER